MAIEIERKFLVKKEKLPPLPEGEHFIQGYLAMEPSIRYRMVNDKVTITIKSLPPGNRERHEFEFTNILGADDRDILKGLAIKKPIEKIRYKIPFADLVWEIDAYQGENEGLITADVELPSVDHVITFPEWIDSEKEIGGNSKYFNSNLGDNPFKNWAI